MPGSLRWSNPRVPCGDQSGHHGAGHGGVPAAHTGRQIRGGKAGRVIAPSLLTLTLNQPQPQPQPPTPKDRNYSLKV